MSDSPVSTQQPNDQSETAAMSGGDRALRQRTQTFVTGWQQTLSKQWQPEHASAIYEDLERLAAMAEAQAASAIAEPALELTVYLCSFVDGGAIPNPAQRQGLEQLIERLAAASREAPARSAARKLAPVAAQSSHRHAFYLRRNAQDLPGLAARLGQQGYIVRPFEEREALLLALEEISPDVLLVDDAFVAEVHGLTDAVMRQAQVHKDPALCLVLATETDITRTLFAQRAGADAVVTERDPIALVARMNELWAQRRALDYRVLIVEDDHGQAKFCESILRHRGMITSVCERPELVPTAIDEFKPDLILLDLYLPGSNGIEVAQRIREQAGHAFLPIVFLSGEHDLDLRFDAIRIGADDFITKPVKPRHLVTAVESRVKRARQLSSGQASGQSDRRGVLSGREVLAREIIRAVREEQDRCPVLALIAVDAVEDVERSVGFVATGTLAQQLAAALAAEVRGARTLCAWGQLTFVLLLHGDDELAVRERLESLQAMLQARPWLSDDAPVQLHFSLGGLRLNPDIRSAEDALERVRALCMNAAQADANRCQFDLRAPSTNSDENPQRRLVRAILRAPTIRGTAQFEFQPLVPLSGQIANQYEVRMTLKPPKSSQALQLQREDYLVIARELDMLAHVDRHLLRGTLERLREHGDAAREQRLYLPIAVANLFDAAFAPWLAAELRSQGVPSAALVLQFDAAEIKSDLARMRKAPEALQRLGVRLALQLDDVGSKDLQKWLDLEAFGIVKFTRVEAHKAEAAWAPWAGAISTARSLGKITIASGLGGMADIGVLLKLGVHYAQGDVLGGWLPDWSFDFAEAVL